MVGRGRHALTPEPFLQLSGSQRQRSCRPGPGEEYCSEAGKSRGPPEREAAMKIRKILLATDFSACSCQAFAPAADLARRLGAFIELVNCIVYPGCPDAASGSRQDLRRLHLRNLELEGGDPAFRGVPITAYFLEG